jgi:hypothetical protein
MRGVTIDQLDIKIHERYAKDQEALDPKYITESTAIAAYSEIASTSSIYPSSWELLFDLQVKNIPWASFSPPLRYGVQSNRFFSSQTLPSIYFYDQTEDEEEEPENEEKQKKGGRKRLALLKKVINRYKRKLQSITDFENQKTAIVNLLESISYLDKLLGQINAKKRQYQKG